MHLNSIVYLKVEVSVCLSIEEGKAQFGGCERMLN